MAGWPPNGTYRGVCGRAGATERRDSKDAFSSFSCFAFRRLPFRFDICSLFVSSTAGLFTFFISPLFFSLPRIRTTRTAFGVAHVVDASGALVPAYVVHGESECARFLKCEARDEEEEERGKQKKHCSSWTNEKEKEREKKKDDAFLLLQKEKKSASLSIARLAPPRRAKRHVLTHLRSPKNTTNNRRTRRSCVSDASRCVFFPSSFESKSPALSTFFFVFRQASSAKERKKKVDSRQIPASLLVFELSFTSERVERASRTARHRRKTEP